MEGDLYIIDLTTLSDKARALGRAERDRWHRAAGGLHKPRERWSIENNDCGTSRGYVAQALPLCDDATLVCTVQYICRVHAYCCRYHSYIMECSY